MSFNRWCDGPPSSVSCQALGSLVQVAFNDHMLQDLCRLGSSGILLWRRRRISSFSSEASIGAKRAVSAGILSSRACADLTSLEYFRSLTLGLCIERAVNEYVEVVSSYAQNHMAGFDKGVPACYSFPFVTVVALNRNLDALRIFSPFGATACALALNDPCIPDLKDETTSNFAWASYTRTFHR